MTEQTSTHEDPPRHRPVAEAPGLPDLPESRSILLDFGTGLFLGLDPRIAGAPAFFERPGIDRTLGTWSWRG